MDGVHEQWGRRVRDRRLDLRLTQARLAEICQLGQATISRIEAGESCPSDRVKWVLAGALGTTVEDLFPYPAVRPPFPGVAEPETTAEAVG